MNASWFIAQLTEKRIVRALFNMSQIPEMGKVIDYEVPLKDTEDAEHGDIDLLCVESDTCLCVEAKKPDSSESILKAIIQAYTYTSLVSTKNESFLNSFGLNTELQLTPAVLTFATAQSGRQLNQVSKYPNLLRLLGMLNSKLADTGIASIRFFVVQNQHAQLLDCLTTIMESNGDVKAIFREGFELSVLEKCLNAV